MEGMNNQERFTSAVAQFDALNAQDPNKRVVEGVEVAYELFFADRMTEWVNRLVDEPSEVLLLSARCQHLCRWESPRSSYPDGRAGYLKWRADLKKFHADKSAKVLRSLGYNEATVDRVHAINMKQGLQKVEEVQLIEDALCLVFLEVQYDDLIAKTDDEKMIRILQKTWGKMSEKGHSEALKMEYSDKGLSLIQLALK